MNRVVIVAAKRTPQGRFRGALAKRSAVDLACAAGAAALAPIGPANIDLVIVGNVLSAGLGMNIGRQIGVILGAPLASPGFTVNMMCASGMKAVMLAADAIHRGEADVVLCGGTESMSKAPYVLDRAYAGLKLGGIALVDTLQSRAPAMIGSRCRAAAKVRRSASRCSCCRSRLCRSTCTSCCSFFWASTSVLVASATCWDCRAI